jgi:hypothetical protein
MITRKLTQTRANTSVNFYIPSAEVLNLLNQYTDSDVTIVVSDNNLTQTITITLTEDNHALLGANDILNNAKINRENYCNTNLIPFNIVES